VARLAELIEALGALPGVTLRVDEPVARHSALRMGGEVEAWVMVQDEAGLKAAMAALRRAGLNLREHQPLGDHFAREEGLSGALLRLGPGFAVIQREGDRLRVGAATPMAQLGVEAARIGLDAWAEASTWPGTLGGWLLSREPQALLPSVHSVRALVGRSLKDHPVEVVSKGKAVILGAELVARPAGGLGAAPLAPGALFAVDARLQRAMVRSRLPGIRLRRIRLADEQAGIAVNLGGGSSRDLDLVLRLVKDRLMRDHGIEVEPRLQPLGLPPKKRSQPRGDPPWPPRGG
jgi:UDP-N-acetylmuramate dehydrogenase